MHVVAPRTLHSAAILTSAGGLGGVGGRGRRRWSAQWAAQEGGADGRRHTTVGEDNLSMPRNTYRNTRTAAMRGTKKVGGLGSFGAAQRGGAVVRFGCARKRSGSAAAVRAARVPQGVRTAGFQKNALNQLQAGTESVSLRQSGTRPYIVRLDVFEVSAGANMLG